MNRIIVALFEPVRTNSLRCRTHISRFPTQLLVVVIVFTYAVICPVILPVGLAYFVGALIVYKKQVLYVYTPVYESGGAMFPGVIQRSLFGLVCAQLTLLGKSQNG